MNSLAAALIRAHLITPEDVVAAEEKEKREAEEKRHSDMLECLAKLLGSDWTRAEWMARSLAMSELQHVLSAQKNDMFGLLVKITKNNIKYHIIANTDRILTPSVLDAAVEKEFHRERINSCQPESGIKGNKEGDSRKKPRKEKHETGVRERTSNSASRSRRSSAGSRERNDRG